MAYGELYLPELVCRKGDGFPKGKWYQQLDGVGNVVRPGNTKHHKKVKRIARKKGPHQFVGESITGHRVVAKTAQELAEKFAVKPPFIFQSIREGKMHIRGRLKGCRFFKEYL